MESLLCEEVLWDSSPHVDNHRCYTNSLSTINDNNTNNIGFHMSKEDCENALHICLEKEKNYLPTPNYVHYLSSNNNNLVVARLKIIHCFIKCQIRLNLSLETIFYATNYFDRFMSINFCKEWKDWMVELVCIACLSIASKFGDDTTSPTLHEINHMVVEEDVWEENNNGYLLFEAKTIQGMELIILKALDWRVGGKTLLSFVEMFSHTIFTFKPFDHHQLIDLLIQAISDVKMLEFRPSIVAVSALRCYLEELNDPPNSSLILLSSINTVFSHNQKEDLGKCYEMLKMEWMINKNTKSLYNFVANNANEPSSPTTVLLKEHINLCDSHIHVDLSLFTHNFGDQSRSRKRPRNEISIMN